MKNLLVILLGLLFLTAQAQVPQKFNYQAVARNSSGQPLTNKTIKAKISILEGVLSKSILYSEIRTVKTNQLGLFSFAIGSSNPQSSTGSFKDISWRTGNKYIKVEIDPAGGNSFTTIGTTELLSVPYALYALQSGTETTKNARSAAAGDNIYDVDGTLGGGKNRETK